MLIHANRQKPQLRTHRNINGRFGLHFYRICLCKGETVLTLHAAPLTSHVQLAMPDGALVTHLNSNAASCNLHNHCCPPVFSNVIPGAACSIDRYPPGKKGMSNLAGPVSGHAEKGT